MTAPITAEEKTRKGLEMQTEKSLDIVLLQILPYRQ